MERFKRIGITLDRYKQMPRKMPEKYIWVNIPTYILKVFDADTIALESKVICGKPSTATPIITSSISDIVLYPTWTVPQSLIEKDMLSRLWVLRKHLSDMTPQEAMEFLQDRLRRTQSNEEFLISMNG